MLSLALPNIKPVARLCRQRVFACHKEKRSGLFYTNPGKKQEKEDKLSNIVKEIQKRSKKKKHSGAMTTKGNYALHCKNLFVWLGLSLLAIAREEKQGAKEMPMVVGAAALYAAFFKV